MIKAAVLRSKGDTGIELKIINITSEVSIEILGFFICGTEDK